MTRPVDALLHHLRGVADSKSAFEAGFAKSILKQSKRRNWKPSPKQRALIEQLVGDIFSENECEVLEDFHG